MSNTLLTLLDVLSEGDRVTATQARTLLGAKNVADLVYRARNLGVSIYTNRDTVRGKRVFSYRLGSPSEAFLKYRSYRQIARSRKTLYREAIPVKMNG